MQNLYIQIHIPFCYKRCSYCSMPLAKYDPLLMKDYTKALLREIEASAEEYQDSIVDAVCIDGGSPTLLGTDALQSILRSVHHHFHLSEDCQISLETMPGDYSRALMQKMPELGVNHWIIGLESADLKENNILDRPYKYEAISMVDVALKTFPLKDIHFEILYGIPGQTMHSWMHSLEVCMYYDPSFITLLPLNAGRGSALRIKIESGQILDCSMEERASFLTAAENTLLTAGYTKITDTTYAKPGCIDHRQLAHPEQLGIGYLARTVTDGMTYINGHSLKEYLNHPDDPTILADQIMKTE